MLNTHILAFPPTQRDGIYLTKNAIVRDCVQRNGEKEKLAGAWEVHTQMGKSSLKAEDSF